MEYRTVKTNHLAQLRVERVVELETEHVRCSLRLEDAQSANEQATIRSELADLEARIAIHVEVIESSPAPADETSGNGDADGDESAGEPATTDDPPPDFDD